MENASRRQMHSACQAPDLSSARSKKVDGRKQKKSFKNNFKLK
jgi:hypothetical protein